MECRFFVHIMELTTIIVESEMTGVDRESYISWREETGNLTSITEALERIIGASPAMMRPRTSRLSSPIPHPSNAT